MGPTDYCLHFRVQPPNRTEIGEQMIRIRSCAPWIKVSEIFLKNRCCVVGCVGGVYSENTNTPSYLEEMPDVYF